MRKISRFTLLFLLLPFHTLIGQSSFAPLGSYWNYDYNSHSGNMSSHQTIKISQESINLSDTIKTLTVHEDIFFALPPFQTGQYVYQIGHLVYRDDSVFYTPSYPNNQRFLFSFHMSVGDSIPIEGGIDLYVRVVNLDTISLSGQMKQRWFLKKYCGTTFMYDCTVIEDIGPVDDYLLWNTEGCLLGQGYWTFQCYSSDSLAYNLPCIPVVVGMQEALPLANEWTISPNPASDRVQIAWDGSFQNVHLQVLDLQGRVVHEVDGVESEGYSLEIGNLSTGTYMLRLLGYGFSGTKRLVKVE